MTTAIQGAYVPFTCSNLTQTVTRSGSTWVGLNALDLVTSTTNFSRVYTLTFTISGTAYPSSISIESIQANGITITRVSPTVITISSEYTNSEGVKINNWAYFKLLLKYLRVVTDNSVWPNPACTISTSITDGTTTLTGALTVSSLSAIAPSAPVATGLRLSRISTSISWSASTQSLGPGIGGYEVWKDGSLLVTIPGTSTLSYIDNTASIAAASYYVKAYDLTGSPIYSVSSNTISISLINSVFVTGYTNGAVKGLQTSIDGITWTAQAVPNNTAVYEVPVLASKTMLSIVKGTTESAYSIDGLNWTASTLPFTCTDIKTNGTIFVATRGINTSSFAYSSDGITWSTGSFPISATWSISYFGPLWVATGSSSTYLTSSDGITWTSRASPNTNFSPVAYGGGVYIAYYGTTGDMYTSTDCISWTLRTNILPGVNQKFSYTNSQFVGLPANVGGTGCYSSNGITWSTFSVPTTPGTPYWCPPAYGAGKWVSVNSNTSATTIGLYSTTLSSWTTSTVTSGGYAVGNYTWNTPIILYKNNLFVTIGSWGTSKWVITSPDGVTWTQRVLLGSPGAIFNIAYC